MPKRKEQHFAKSTRKKETSSGLYEGIHHCNASNFGLQGCVFTRDINKAILISDAMETGAVQINSAPARGPDHFPFQACLAPDNGKPFAENLIGSRIKVWCVEGHAQFLVRGVEGLGSYEGDIVSYDPIEKKHKARDANGDEKLLLLEKEQWEFVGDESGASGDGVSGVCRMPKESSIDNIRRSNDDPLKRRAVKGCNTTNMAIDCEDKNERSTFANGTLLKNLVL
ncbi:NADP-dependent glyceraldehyde-3-phosphate dehydrogenase, putative, partial [Ricinus communis]